MKIRCNKILPFGNMVAVKFDTVDRTDGGLLLPDAAVQAFPARAGTVVELGPGAYFDTGARRKIDLKAGERVIAAGFGLVVSEDGADVELINVDNVLARLEDGK